jgi:hypothetical protein
MILFLINLLPFVLTLPQQVALQMAEANSHKASALRKSSAASSGASSSSAASSSAAGAHQLLQMPKTPSSTSAAAAATTNVPCPQCKRTYKSAQKMEQHQRIVHHSFMAKISPTKRPVISPSEFHISIGLCVPNEASTFAFPCREDRQAGEGLQLHEVPAEISHKSGVQ